MSKIDEQLQTEFKAWAENAEVRYSGLDFDLDCTGENFYSPETQRLFKCFCEIKQLKAQLATKRINSVNPFNVYAYVDLKGRLVKISGKTYFDGGFVSADRVVPDSWTRLIPLTVREL